MKSSQLLSLAEILIINKNTGINNYLYVKDIMTNSSQALVTAPITTQMTTNKLLTAILMLSCIEN